MAGDLGCLFQVGVMEHEIDSPPPTGMFCIIVRQQAIIENLEKRIAQLEGRAKSRVSGRMPGLKSKSERKPDRPRSHASLDPTALPGPARRLPSELWWNSVDCGTQLSGGWTQRTREVIDLPQVPVEVTDRLPRPHLPGANGVVRPPRNSTAWCWTGSGRSEPGQPDCRVAKEARLPWRTIQWYLDTVPDCISAWGPSWLPRNGWPAKPRG